jgi:hypothetical protein
MLAIHLKRLDILRNNSDVPIRKPVPILSRVLTHCLREESCPE